MEACLIRLNHLYKKKYGRLLGFKNLGLNV